MFISRPTYENDVSANIAITMDAISAGRPAVAAFCKGTSLVAYEPQRRGTGRSAPVDDLSWWKPFLHLRGPERIAGPAEARRLFTRASETRTAERDICIDQSNDDVLHPAINAASASVFTSMRNRNTVAMPAYHDARYHADPVEDTTPDADVIAERVTAPVELRFFPQHRARAPVIIDG